jgi:hypothetical protein
MDVLASAAKQAAWMEKVGRQYMGKKEVQRKGRLNR